MKKKNIAILTTLVVIILSTFLYLNDYYKAVNIDNYLKDNELVKVKKDKSGIYYDGPGRDNFLIFYPGAKVEFTAYSPLMYSLAEVGIDTYIVDFPFNIAFMKMNAAKTIIKNYKYDNYYLGGHSLGGVVATQDSNKNNIKGLILLASYPTEKTNCKVLSIYSNQDGVLNIDKYKENIKLVDDLNEIIIEGGNHAYFGNYGEQKGDKKATISRDNQQEITKIEILKFINQE